MCSHKVTGLLATAHIIASDSTDSVSRLTDHMMKVISVEIGSKKKKTKNEVGEL